ncbi:PssE/Cps14G family polysaccharide biosynthesis glycosyltransferase [Enterococcus cecorum]|uniref:PssE/Cps14G family polysaccharide biosynthesis glycosyltransferase n=1 Tax=Enterococcus cecorum TaxID=44008 RepID=UPI00200A6DBF|nr:PssE/Cps14G family polysaccharide biosynthesis glycosyltransferase [Enterococcus cecorum]
MILITLGSQKFQFNRLLMAAEKIHTKDVVFAQIGYSDYIPQNYEYQNFLSREEFDSILEKSDIVITHGGTGAIMNSLKKGKKVIAVPRLSKFNEHIDDHQIQIVRQFEELNLICVCEDMNLSNAIDTVKNTTFQKYKSNTSKMIKSIENFIEEI